MSEGTPAGPTPPPGPARGGLGRLLRAATGGDPVIAALMLALCAWYVLTRGIFQGKASGDGFFGFMYLPGLVYFHTFDIAPNVPQWVPYLGHEKTGHVANACPVGPILFWFPTYLLGLGLEALVAPLAPLAARLPSLRWLVPYLRPAALPGQTPFDFWMAGLGSLFAGLAGVGLLFRLLRRKLGVAAARAGVIGGVMATPIAFYLVTQPLYQHATAFFCVTLFVERWDAFRSDASGLTVRRLALLGALAGLAMEMRIQEAIFLLLPGLDVAAALGAALVARRWRRAGQELTGGLAMAAMALLVFLPQLALWHWYFAALRTPQPAGHMRWLDPALLATMFSTRAGIFPWMPIFYLVVPGLVLGRRPLGRLAGPLSLLFCVELWVNASAWDHWGSWAFGPRRFSDATVTFAAGVGGLYWFAAERARRRGDHRDGAGTRWVTVAIAALVAWNVLLAELVRTPGRLKSSGAGAFPAAQWVKWAHGPAWLGAFLDRVGYPFVQPAGWIYALVYRVPVSTFEGVVGNYLLERDCRVHAVSNVHGLSFAEPGSYVPEGLLGPADATTRLRPAARHVRVLLPMFAAEPVGVSLSGSFGGNEAAVEVRWNGARLTTRFSPSMVQFEVPEAMVHSRARTNELTLELPAGSQLGSLELVSRSEWWR